MTAKAKGAGDSVATAARSAKRPAIVAGAAVNRQSPVEVLLDGLTHRRGAHKRES